jgi:hypothetical protein
MGTSFFKTSVTITVLDRNQGMYGIGINAAYVGDEPEQGLADYFGIPRALLSCSVEVETEPLPDNRFEFDFEPVLRKLDTVLETKKITGGQVAQAIKPSKVDGEGFFLLQSKDGLSVRIRPGCVESRMLYDRPIKAGQKPRDSWSVKGSVLSGELLQDYGSKDENAKKPPTFLIVVSPAKQPDSDSYAETMPIWQPDQQEKAIDLVNKIAAALS